MFVVKATSTTGFPSRYLRANKYAGSRSWASNLQEARTFETESKALLALANNKMNVSGGLALQKVEREVRGMPWNVETFIVQVASDTNPSRSYTVTIGADTATCTCPDHQFRGRCCKHIRRVLDMTGMKSVRIIEV